MSIQAAGNVYTADGRILLLKRRDGTWGITGGDSQPDETPRETANREAREEIGFAPDGLLLWSVSLPRRDGDGAFTAFAIKCKETFTPKLNDEHTAYGWFKGDDLPAPLFGSTADILDRFTANMGDICRKIAEGKYTSPELFYNVTLFAMRISGTGWAYRGGDKQEYAYRDRDVWLTPGVMEAFQGLPVVFDHPEGPVIEDNFYRDRVVGSVVYPYVKDKELWGIVRIQDRAMAEQLTKQPWSTSPGVLTGKDSIGTPLGDGQTLILEDVPFHPDHLAIVPAGVWDKYGPPTGIDTPLNKRIKELDTMAELSREKTRAAYDALRQKAKDKRHDASRKDDAEGERVYDKALEDLDKLKGLFEGAKAEADRKDGQEPDEKEIARELVRIGRDIEKHDTAPTDPAQPSSFIPGEPAPEQSPATEEPSEMPENGDELAQALLNLVPSQDEENKPMEKEELRKEDKERTDKKDKKDTMAAPATVTADRKDEPGNDAQKNEMLATMVAHMRENGCSDAAIAQCVTDCGGNPAEFVDLESDKDRAVRDRLDELNKRDEEARAELERLQRRTRPLSDEEHNEISEAESKTDAVAQPLGLQTPRYIPGESVAGYQRRCAKLLQPHSTDWKNADLSELPPEVFALASRQIHKDAQEAARRPVRYKDSDPVRPVTQRSPTGHTRTEYRGSFKSAFGEFMA
ncbi:NUDIX domain-containing protein [Saccharibacter sp. 17.LH.SD]|uniref:NUDIX domain-containing protein n=1 Tax=Saccharibacter sp. 17.LH.SD TaxID=2689393 RepID=UPI00136F9D96|nr:NUDIX domain-containing protein [Saccharibacter sp. 17.LH.SD]MXV43472.1 NUDIX domain-containing protein [Saccharibacter sp. 17.LH.SD]